MITTGPLVPDATVRPPDSVAPLAGQPESVRRRRDRSVGADPCRQYVTTLIAAVVGPSPVTLIVIVYT